jgi:hypothetical protein
VSRPQITTLQAIFASQRTRREALLTASAGVFAIDAMPGVHRIRAAIAQEGTPVAAPATAEYPELVVIAADFSFELPASISGGLTRLTLRNDGAVDHHAMFMRLNEGSTLAELEETLTQPDPAPIFAVAQSLGGPEVGAGRQATVIAALPLGQYMVICVIPEADGTPHYMMGMQAPLEVVEPTIRAVPPTADMTVELVDFAFEMPSMRVAPGPQIWEVPNVGEQVHELVIFQLAPGVTFEQAQAIFSALPEPGATPAADAAMASPPAAGLPPFTLVGGVAPMNPGYTNWAVLDLDAGDYIAICFVPDPATGMPHFALGMIMPFNVG